MVRQRLPLLLGLPRSLGPCADRARSAPATAAGEGMVAAAGTPSPRAAFTAVSARAALATVGGAPAFAGYYGYPGWYGLGLGMGLGYGLGYGYGGYGYGGYGGYGYGGYPVYVTPGYATAPALTPSPVRRGASLLLPACPAPHRPAASLPALRLLGGRFGSPIRTCC